jgi:NAD(P)-dependent dehydrogenase (short-subunit alcohol dehydrogenase family)
MTFTGKRALVTGGSSGIGRACALDLARRGASVAVTGRRRQALDETVSIITAGRPGAAHAIVADLTLAADRERCLAAAVSFLGGLDILVNAAGILEAGSIESTSLEAWTRTMEINVSSLFHMTQLALPHLETVKGSIVNLSSVAGPRPYPGLLAYCVSKAAVDQLTRCLSLEVAGKGIRVNAVNPGVVVTNLHRAGGMSESNYEAFLERGKSTHPLGRVGTAEEVAGAVAFLASPEAAWITGVTLGVDGGRANASAR